MRILFLNRSYHPDVEATGQLLAELCADLAKGHDVTVIAGQPNAVKPARGQPLILRDRHDGVTVIRVRNLRFTRGSLIGRAAGLASYLVLGLLAGLCVRRPDVIVVETDPPFLGILGAVLKWWHGRPMVFYLQDLYPELGLVTGRLRPGPLAALLRWSTQFGLRHADRVVVLGEDMRRRVLRRGVAADRIEVVPNWADTAALRPVKHDNPCRRQWGLDGRFAVMYSGNIGLMQNLEQVLEVAHRFLGEPVEFLFVGDGGSRAGLMSKASLWSLDNVRFLPYQPREALGASLSAADLHLIPLRRGLAGCLVPSKVYGILAAATPYVAAVDPDSEVADLTRDARTGLLIEPDSPDQLHQAIRWCLQNRDELDAMGLRGRALAEERFDRPRAAARFARVLDLAVHPTRATAAPRTHGTKPPRRALQRTGWFNPEPVATAAVAHP